MLGEAEIQAIEGAKKATEADKYIRTLEQPLELNMFGQLNLQDYKVVNIRATNNDTVEREAVFFGGNVPERQENTNRLIPTSTISTGAAGDVPVDVAYNSSNNRLYVTSFVGNAVAIINPDTGVIVATVATGAGTDPNGVAYNPIRNSIYVTDNGGAAVFEIDSNNVIINTLVVAVTPRDIIYNSVTEKLYVTSLVGGTITIIDASDNTILAALAGHASPQAITFSTLSGKVYVASELGDSVVVVDTDDTIDTTIAGVGGAPFGIAYNEANNRIYVTRSSLDDVRLIDPDTNTLLATPTISVGDLPRFITYNTQNESIYVSNRDDDTITVIDSGNTVVDTFAVGDVPRHSIYVPSLNRLYVVNESGDTLSVLSSTVSIVTGAGYEAAVKEFASMPVILKHIRYIADTPLQLSNILSYNYDTPEGLVKQWSFQPQDWVSAQSQSNFISEIYEAEGRIVDNKGYLSINIRTGESNTLKL